MVGRLACHSPGIRDCYTLMTISAETTESDHRFEHPALPLRIPPADVVEIGREGMTLHLQMHTRIIVRHPN